MPNVPPELERAAEAAMAPVAELAADDSMETMPTDPPKPARPSAGAIWEAVPSVIGSQRAEEIEEEEKRDGPERGDDSALQASAHKAEAVRRSLIGPDAHSSQIAEAYRDPALARLDRLVERSAWDQLDKELAAQDGASTPALNLLRVIAKRELQSSEDKGAQQKLTRETIALIAKLLGVPESSPTALLLAKRLLRRNPIWAQTTTPSTGLSASVVLGGLAIGVGVGWLVTKLFL